MNILILELALIVFFVGRWSLDGKNRLLPMPVASLYAGIVLVLITGFRYMVGFDYPTYYQFLNNPIGKPYFEAIPQFFYYCAYVTKSPWVLFFLFSFFTLAFTVLEIKNDSANAYESFIIFFSLFYLESLNIIRQWLAVALVFYAFRYVRQKKLFSYLFCCIIATFMHSSAILAVPIYFIYNYVPFGIILVGDMVVCFAFKRAVPFFMHLLHLERYTGYILHPQTDGSNKVAYMFMLLFLLSSLVYLLSSKPHKAKLRKYMSVVAVALIFPVLIGAKMGIRLGLYYNVLYILLLPLCLDRIRFRFIRRQVAMLPFYAYYCLYLYIDFINNKGFSPYQFYFLRNA